MTETVRARLKIPYRPHQGQSEFHDDPHRFRVMACGRRFGKTLAACAEAVRAASRKTRAVVWWVAPTFSLASIGWRKLEELLPPQVITQKSISERRFVLVNGSSLWVKSADNPDSLRGEGLDLAIIDEAAFVKEQAWIASLRPALADKLGRGVFISTPLGRNWFYQSFLRGQGDDPEWKSWRFKTTDNPTILPEEVEAARRGMPERIFKQEFEAEFIEDSGSVFRKIVEAATAAEVEKGEGTVMGVDWGKHADFTCITVLDDSGRMLAMDRFNEIDYQFQLGRLRAMVGRYKPKTIIAELNAMGEPLVEQLQREGLPVIGFQTTLISKTKAIEALSLAFERGEISILPDRTLVNELQAYEISRSPGGSLHYGAPQGLHDDCVMSLALAWHGMATGGPLLLWGRGEGEDENEEDWARTTWQKR